MLHPDNSPSPCWGFLALLCMVGQAPQTCSPPLLMWMESQLVTLQLDGSCHSWRSWILVGKQCVTTKALPNFAHVSHQMRQGSQWTGQMWGCACCAPALAAMCTKEQCGRQQPGIMRTNGLQFILVSVSPTCPRFPCNHQVSMHMQPCRLSLGL